MLRGCLFALFFWLALAGGYWYWFDQVYDPPGSIIGAIFVGLITSLCLGSIMNSRTALRDWSLATASRNGLRLEDGRMLAVCGTIHPVDQPLVAPFSGRECVICEYDIGRPVKSPAQNGNQSNASDFAGFLMTPCAIRTEQGDVRLLGYPILEDIPDVVCSGFDAAKNGFEFLNRTEFENRTGLKMVTILSVFGEVWSDDDGAVQKNMQLRNIQPEELFTLQLFEQLLQQKQAPRDHRESEPEKRPQNREDDSSEDDWSDENRDAQSEDVSEQEDEFDDELASDDIAFSYSTLPRMTEKRIDVGESVCLIGKFSEMQQGLLPEPGSSHPNRLIRGTLEQLEQKSRRSFFSRLLGGALVLIIVNAAVYGMTLLYQHSPDTINRRQQEASQAIQNDDPEKIKELLHRGLDPNFRDQNGRTLLDRALELRRDQIADLLRNAGALQQEPRKPVQGS
ncbi:MAG: hypothetical protein KDA77_05315 [Planctomycetaceae bacterium]|nr:hypothetical protein [Planctomycetaceae bacterium]